MGGWVRIAMYICIILNQIVDFSIMCGVVVV